MLLDGEPDYVPFYELFADREIMNAVVGRTTPRREVRTREEIRRYFQDLSDYKKEMEIAVQFYHKLDYD